MTSLTNHDRKDGPMAVVSEKEVTDRALKAMARIVRDWDATSYEVAKRSEVLPKSSDEELRIEPGGYAGLGVFSYRPWITDQDIDALRAYLEIHRPSVGAMFHRLAEAVAERYRLDHDEALRYIRESCNAGGFPNPEEEPELVEQLREAARDEPNLGWLTEGTEERRA